MKYRGFVVAGILIIHCFGCKKSTQHPEIVVPKISEIQNFKENYFDEELFVGGDYIDQDNNRISVNKITNAKIQLTILGDSRNKESVCNLPIVFNKVNSRLYVGYFRRKKVFLSLSQNKLSFSTEDHKKLKTITSKCSATKFLKGVYKKFVVSNNGR